MITGVALGLVISAALTRLMSHLLSGVGPRDPLTFAAVAAAGVTAGLAAAYLPARGAMRTGLIQALRQG